MRQIWISLGADKKRKLKVIKTITQPVVCTAGVEVEYRSKIKTIYKVGHN